MFADREREKKEKHQFKQERNQFSRTVKKQRDIIDQLDQGQNISILEIQSEPIRTSLEEIREIILQNPILENYPNEWWVSRMKMEKSCVETVFLRDLFQGWMVFRSNAFISKGFNKFEADHFFVVNELWKHNKRKILAMLANEWVSFNKHEKPQWNTFATPFAEELMGRGLSLIGSTRLPRHQMCP